MWKVTIKGSFKYTCNIIIQRVKIFRFVKKCAKWFGWEIPTQNAFFCRRKNFDPFITCMAIFPVNFFCFHWDSRIPFSEKLFFLRVIKYSGVFSATFSKTWISFYNFVIFLTSCKDSFLLSFNFFSLFFLDSKICIENTDSDLINEQRQVLKDTLWFNSFLFSWIFFINIEIFFPFRNIHFLFTQKSKC